MTETVIPKPLRACSGDQTPCRSGRTGQASTLWTQYMKLAFGSSEKWNKKWGGG